jgi:hypothetical protein
VGALALACTLVLATGASAAHSTAAAAPCWKALLNDWYDGRIDNLYPIPCYRQAINHLPTDIRVYSSAHDDIDRALAVAIAHKKNPNAPVPTVTDGQTGTSTPGRTTDEGPIPSAIDSSSPGGATSFPLPLLILGGLALFLLAAGAVGLVVRRMQGRGDGGGPPPPATP